MQTDCDSNNPMHRRPANLEEVRRRLAGVRGVTGVGFGLKETAGKRIHLLAWRIYVTEKLPRKLLSPGGLVPSWLLGFPTDVVRRESTFASSFSNKQDAFEGAMIANQKGVPGTLGCWAWSAVTGEPVLLSNYHVLFGKRGRPGDVIWRVRPGHPRNDFQPIARSLLGKAGNIKFRGTDYFIDAAIGVRDGSADAICEESTTESRPAAADAVVGSVVSKCGAATGCTVGRIVDVCYPDRWHYDLESAAAPNQLLIQPESGGNVEKSGAFSRMGDSGAVIRDGASRIVGLLWGSNARGEGIACHIGAVLNGLGIRLQSKVDAD
jgi:hypothetical protein